MKRFVPLLVASLLGCVSAREWPISLSERMAGNLLQGRLQQLDQEIARIASGDSALRSAITNVALGAVDVDRATEALKREAARSRELGDVALVLSGSNWVPSNR